MCKFFSFVTEPEGHPNERFYFNWKERKKDFDGADSHDHIISYYKLPDSKCNSYEYNPLTKAFEIDQQNSGTDDRVQAERWVEGLDWKRIVEPLIIKPIINPFTDCKKVKKPTAEQIEVLKKWDSVRDSMRDSVGASVLASVGASVRASVLASVMDSMWDSVGASVLASVMASVRASVLASVMASVGASVRASVWESVWAYISSFFDVKYGYDFTPAIKLWEQGLVPSFSGETWRLHSGKNADVVYSMVKIAKQS